MKRTLITLMAAAAILTGTAAFAQMKKPDKPYIVLVHGAFADATSWDGVAKILRKDGYHVIAAANPLRSVKGDGQYIGSLVEALKDPVVLVGHSYGGSVITEAANGHANVKALVYVAAFSPETGESAVELSGKFPGSTLGPTLSPPVPLADGGKDLYILQDKFPAQFAADVPVAQASLMAVAQRPVTEAALNEKSGQAGWKQIPSWHIYGSADKNIPPAAMAFMAKRAQARDTKVVSGASHVVMVSHPVEVAKMIEEAASAP
ncbi:alpha/beta hydrolase [Dyella terrae]|uniref:Alpha/beta hydrolase n=3 Tax=Dyella TaxID=231454 RepID=A0A4R0Z077_9GAMM|nr:alpha/beta hydrolase [Dyella soli]TBR39389.1 alpha/beta hydrolase [Dyella terrae]TCI13024.1 alpha/beta hydrolase [Dyella soli]